MIVRNGRVAPRQSAQAPRAYKSAGFPSPTLGWIANSNLAEPKPGGAHILENLFPTATSAILRRGKQIHAQVGDGSEPVVSLFTYIAGSTEFLFAATPSAIYNVSASSAPDFLSDDLGVVFGDDEGDEIIVSDVAPIEPEVGSLTGGEWVTTQFTNADGRVVIRAVNGADTPLVFDGTSWSTSPAITFPTGAGALTPDVLSYVWQFKGRLFFIQKNTLDAWYLAANALGGELKKLPLGNSFKRGGSLLFGVTWSLETGGGGLSEQCAFVSTEGEVVVFQGTDPDSAATWSRVGTYRIGRPLGAKAHIQAGGDVVIATDIAFVALSQATQKDFAVLAPSAVSASIEAAWNEAVKMRGGGAWNCLVWSNSQMVIVAPPAVNDEPPLMYVANARTGAWTKFTNWNANCLEVFKGRLFFGDENGLVIEGNVTGLDINDEYTGVYVPLFNDLGEPGIKTTSMARATLRSLAKPRELLSMQRNFETILPSAPPTTASDDPNAWGVGKWGEMRWGVSLAAKTYQFWRSTPKTGYVVAPALQITSGSVTPLDVEVIRVDIAYTGGDTVV